MARSSSFDRTILTIALLVPPGLCRAGAMAVRDPRQVNKTQHQALHSTKTQLAEASEPEVFTPSAGQETKLKLPQMIH